MWPNDLSCICTWWYPHISCSNYVSPVHIWAKIATCSSILSVPVLGAQSSTNRPWTQGSSDTQVVGGGGVEGLTFYSLESLCTVHTPLLLPPSHPACLPPPHLSTTLPLSLLPSPKRLQALEMHACVATLCEALSVCAWVSVCVM